MKNSVVFSVNKLFDIRFLRHPLDTKNWQFVAALILNYYIYTYLMHISLAMVLKYCLNDVASDVESITLF